jgi:mannose-6-phosphate isomerase-like protein (cupin superfamily)
MTQMHQVLRFAAVAVLACWGAGAVTDSKRVQYVSAADIDDSVRKTSNGSAYRLLTREPAPPAYVIRRDGPGRVEVHGRLNDLIVVRAGHASVLIGATVQGNKQIKPDEWLGGTIIAGENYELATGDMLFIPAGLGHSITAPAGGSVTYLVVKTEAKP